MKRDFYEVINGYAVSIEKAGKWHFNRGEAAPDKPWRLFIDGSPLTEFRTKAEAVKYARTEVYS